MKINHELINISNLSTRIGLKPYTISSRLKSGLKNKFSDQELMLIKSEFEDLFCYIFEVDEVKIVNDKLIGIA